MGGRMADVVPGPESGGPATPFDLRHWYGHA
jgi:hypothetical protein